MPFPRVKSCWQHRVLWLTLTIRLYHLSLLAGLLDCIQCPHRTYITLDVIWSLEWQMIETDGNRELENFILSAQHNDDKHHIKSKQPHLHTCTYICRIIHSDTTIKMHEGRCKKKRSRKTSLQLYFTSHFIARVRKGCSRFACERVLETEHKLHILTPLLWLSRCVFLVLLMPGSTPSGFPRAPSVGCGFPTTSGLLLSGILLATALAPNWLVKLNCVI